MILCITEKPSVGREIAKILGANNRHDGFFEGNGYCVTWTFGHLCCLKEPADYYPNWRHWSLSALPMIPPRFAIKLIDNDSYKKQFKTIADLILKCDEIINCGDAGQEGELIQRWVMQKAGCKKPVKRLWINSMVDQQIRDGFNNLRDEKDLEPLYIAGLCRAIGDWVLGLNATRLYSLKYGEKGKILSIGRVQTPTLALVVNRQLEIDNFVPTNYWELKTVYRDTLFSSSLKPFDSEEKGVKTVAEIKDQLFTVTDISTKQGTEAPPRLFDLTSLQVECNKKLNLGAEETLKIIQSLYEKKLTTYPRVDTTYLPDEIYRQCPQILKGLTDFSSEVAPLLSHNKGLKKTKKVFDNSKVTDHHAIIPTGEPIRHDITNAERNVFDLIARRFVAAFYPDCTFEQTVVNAKVGKISFKATGKRILDAGWKNLFASFKSNETDEEKEDDEQTLPQFIKDESGPHYPKLVKKTTQPPKYYTEGTLLKAMETAGSNVDDEDLREALKANGIGRPSTRASIIEILYKRGYIVKERKSLRATPAAIELISLIKEDLLKSARLTGIWEGRLRMIEKGEYSADEFISRIKEMVFDITKSVISDPSNRRIITQESPQKSKTNKTSMKTKSKSAKKPKADIQ